MFTGIIENTAVLRRAETLGSGKVLFFESDLAAQLKVDQSVCHNGVCLTVEAVLPKTGQYQVTAIQETLQRSNLGNLQPGSVVNLERSVRMDARLDGHLVQGHVDEVGIITDIFERDGSHEIHVQVPGENQRHLLIEKGSVCVDGISLTVGKTWDNSFSIFIIPYTLEHTNLKYAQTGARVNLEYDILGKYIARYMDTIRSTLFQTP